MGIDDQTGTLESPEKWRMLSIWDRSPFSVYARAEQVYVDGALVI